MKRPVAIWLVVLLLAVSGVYTLWGVATLRRWEFAPVGVLSLLGSGGLVRGRRWSQPVVHLVAAFAVIGWGYGVWRVAAAGWPSTDVMRTIFSLLPGACWVVGWSGSSLLVFRYFRSRH